MNWARIGALLKRKMHGSRISENRNISFDAQLKLLKSAL